jgi:hypothetical protein
MWFRCGRAHFTRNAALSWNSAFCGSEGCIAACRFVPLLQLMQRFLPLLTTWAWSMYRQAYKLVYSRGIDPKSCLFELVHSLFRAGSVTDIIHGNSCKLHTHNNCWHTWHSTAPDSQHKPSHCCPRQAVSNESACLCCAVQSIPVALLLRAMLCWATVCCNW